MPLIILTREATNDLLDTYANIGPDAARELAPRYGIKATYVKKLAYQHGVRAKRKPKIQSQRDRRWQLAIQRGAVIA